jgi:hypothetical protein
VSDWLLTFTARVDYGGYGDLMFPLTISSDINSHVIVRAKLDTGSTFFVFQ